MEMGVGKWHPYGASPLSPTLSPAPQALKPGHLPFFHLLPRFLLPMNMNNPGFPPIPIFLNSQRRITPSTTLLVSTIVLQLLPLQFDPDRSCRTVRTASYTGVGTCCAMI